MGYGVIDIQDGCQRMLDCGIIQTDSGRSDGDRMVEIAGDLRQLIRIWRPELAAVEKFFFYRSSNTINVVQARGVVVMTLALQDPDGGVPSHADQTRRGGVRPCRER